MRVCVCLCYEMYLNMREVAITAPRSKRQTEMDPGEPGHTQPRMSTEDLSRHISAISRAHPSRRRREGLVGALKAKGWESQRRQAADLVRGQTLVLSQGSSKLQTRTHTCHSNGTQRHTKRHVHTHPHYVPNPGIT